MKEQSISISDYHYELPNEKIAKFPLEERDHSKLLVYKNQHIEEATFHQINHYLPANSLLFFNNTRVIPARLFFKTSKDQPIEIFCLEADQTTEDVYGAMLQTQSTQWKCIVGGLAKWKEEFVFLNHESISIKARLIEKQTDAVIIEFSWEPSHKSFSEVLQIAGNIPIPPYLKRSSVEQDAIRYQTTYAKNEGSVAAPTAGLHFTEKVMLSLEAIHCKPVYITLHVGAGTFKPVKSEQMGGHQMHREFMEVTVSAIDSIIINIDKPIVAVGTTSTRTIESLYWLGVKTVIQPTIKKEDLIVNQWDPYEEAYQNITVLDALNALKTYLTKQNLASIYTQTSLLIVPGYNFKIINVLITNFHQPESTLILLVAAFIGEDWRKVYNHALTNHYRFLSYGDSSLLFRN